MGHLSAKSAYQKLQNRLDLMWVGGPDHAAFLEILRLLFSEEEALIASRMPIRFSNLKTICENHLKGQYSIEVIDLLEQPQLSKGDQILAIPTLVRKLPVPVRKIIGDLSDTERVLVGLDLRAGP